MVMITHAGKLIRSSVDGVSRIGRATQGVKVMDLGTEDRVVAVAKIADRDEDEDDDKATDDEGGGGGEGGGGEAMPEDLAPEDPAGEPVN